MKKETKTHLAHGIEKTENFSQYDESIKVLLSDKQVLARIAKHRTEEFRDYDIQAIMESIEGEPEISKHIVYPGKVQNTIIFQYHLLDFQKAIWRKVRIS